MQIAYSWTIEVSRAGARRLVQAMRVEARRLGFAAVSRIAEDQWGSQQTRSDEVRVARRGKEMTEAEFRRHMRRWPGRWFVKNEDDNDAWMQLIEPVWSCYFTAKLVGCDPITAGLSQHIPSLKVQRDWGGVVDVCTGLDGKMAWQCKCETLNAALPQHGGWDNFLAQHTLVLTFLRKVKGLGLELHVWDQGKYWESGNPEVLHDELTRSMETCAEFFGRLKDRVGDSDSLTEIAQVLKHPAFEYLEAKGRKRMRRRDQPSDSEE